MGYGRSYYKDLPSIIQGMVLANSHSEYDKKDFIAGNKPLSQMFRWSASPEGHDFWENIYKGGEIPAEYLVNEEDLFNKVFSLISKVIKHGK